MGSTKRVVWAVGLALAAIGWLVLASAPAGGAVILTLSEHSSDCTSPEVLSATLAFSVTGDMLTVSVTNETAAPHAYYINNIFWSAAPNVTGLELVGPSGWTLDFAEDGNRASPFGEFDAALLGGVGNSPNEVAPGETLDFVIRILGTGPFSDRDFGSEVSHIWSGQIPSLAAMKFIRGPCDDSARGNATAAHHVPEPMTVSFMGAGLLAVWAMGRCRGRGGASSRSA